MAETRFVKENETKGKIFVNVHNLKDLKKGEILKSEKVTIGESVFSASVKVHLIDERREAKTFSKTLVSVHLKNESNHLVVVDYSLSVGEVMRKVYKQKIERKSSWGFPKSMDFVHQGINIVMVITLVSEDIPAKVGKVVDAEEAVVVGKVGDNTNEGLQDQIKVSENVMISHVKAAEVAVSSKLKASEKTLCSKVKSVEDVINWKFEELKKEMLLLKSEVENIKRNTFPSGFTIPECLICYEEMAPPVRIVQCLKGHKICEPCSQKKEVVICPGHCKTGFMGRDLGMEAFVLEIMDRAQGVQARGGRK